MKAYILSAGLGTRLYPITKRTPKVMLPVGNKPLLWYQIMLAKCYGFDDILINLNRNKKQVTDYFKEGKKFGVKITYAFEKKLLGSAGSIKKAESFFKDEPFLVIYGDTLSNTNFKKLLKFHKNKKSMCTISLYETDEPWTQGIIEINKKNQVINFTEKPPKGKEKSKLSNAGVLIFNKEVFKYIPNGKFYDVGSDLLPKLIDTKKVFALNTNSYVLDIGTYARYEKVKQDILNNKVKFPFKIN